MLTMKDAAARRNFFEVDEEFEDHLKPMLEAYNEAARKAEHLARIAVRDGGLVALRQAQWWEAVVSTYERTLAIMREGDPTGKIELPEPPDFGSN